MRSFCTALYYFWWCQVWVSESHLKTGREDESQSFHTYLISMSYPVKSTSILEIVKARRCLSWCLVVEYSLLWLLCSTPHATGFCACRELLWGLNWAVSILMAYMSSFSLAFAKPLCLLPLGTCYHSGDSKVSPPPRWAPQTAPLWTPQAPVLAPQLSSCPSEINSFTASTVWVYICHFHKDFILNHKPTGIWVLQCFWGHDVIVLETLMQGALWNMHRG